MDYTTYVGHVEADGDLLVTAAAQDLSADIPSCPGWTMRDLVEHVAEVYEHKIACTQLGREPDPWPPEWPADRDPIDWLNDARTRLLAMFAEHGPQDPSATWWPPDQTVGFWARRMAHETAVHRVDAQLGVGQATPVDDDLATDGVDEILTIMLAGDWSEAPSDEAAGQRVAISTGGRQWIVALEPTFIGVEEGRGQAAAAVEGDPSDVLLWLWGRFPDERVSLSGDAATLALLRSRLTLATQ